MWAHQSTEMALENVTGHIKETCPPCLFRLPWENVNKSILPYDIVSDITH